MNKLSLVLCSILPALPAFAGVNLPLNPADKATAACKVYNDIRAGMDYSEVKDMGTWQLATSSQVGKIYQWIDYSGYKYTLNFLNNGNIIGFTNTGPIRVVYIPPLRSSDYPYPYPYGAQTFSEREAIYLANRKKITYDKAVELLGTQNEVIGNIYALNWSNGKAITVATNSQDVVTDFSVNAYCGDAWHKDELVFFN